MQKAKVDKMKADGREEIEIRKMNEASSGKGQRILLTSSLIRPSFTLRATLI